MIILDPVDVTLPGVFVSSNVPENDAGAFVGTRIYGLGDQVMDVANHILYESKVGSADYVTIAPGSPGVITWSSHGLTAGAPVSFSTTGALPAGLAINTIYYVLAPTTSTFNVSSSPGGSAINMGDGQSGTQRGSAGPNQAKPPPNSAFWENIGATNRWKMLDAYNNTQTEYPEMIEIKLKPSAIAQGLFLGNVDAAEIEIISTDPVQGEVFHETNSMASFASGSSFYRWLFGRRPRTTQFLTLELPLYYLATVTIRIKNPGATARCGMCRLGPIENFGYSQYGLGTDIKDYSSTKFNFDGTSQTIERGFSKRMTIDIVMNNDMIDYAQEWLAERRQKNLVYIGATQYKSTVLHGKFSSFKNVIEGYQQSKMALQIEGTV